MRLEGPYLHSLNKAEPGVWTKDKPVIPEHLDIYAARLKITDAHAMVALAKVMRFVFDWEETPQGKIYWRQVAHAFAELGTIDGKSNSPFDPITGLEKRALREYLEK